MRWLLRRVNVNSNGRELIGNMADKAHFVPVHGSEEITFFQNISEGHRYTQLMKGRSPAGVMDSKATYHGLGYMIHSMKIDMPDGQLMRFMSLVMNIPTGMDSFEFLEGFKYPVSPGMDGNVMA